MHEFQKVNRLTDNIIIALHTADAMEDARFHSVQVEFYLGGAKALEVMIVTMRFRECLQSSTQAAACPRPVSLCVLGGGYSYCPPSVLTIQRNSFGIVCGASYTVGYVPAEYKKDIGDFAVFDASGSPFSVYVDAGMVIR